MPQTALALSQTDAPNALPPSTLDAAQKMYQNMLDVLIRFELEPGCVRSNPHYIAIKRTIEQHTGERDYDDTNLISTIEAKQNLNRTIHKYRGQLLQTLKLPPAETLLPQENFIQLSHVFGALQINTDVLQYNQAFIQLAQTLADEYLTTPETMQSNMLAEITAKQQLITAEQRVRELERKAA